MNFILALIMGFNSFYFLGYLISILLKKKKHIIPLFITLQQLDKIEVTIRISIEKNTHTQIYIEKILKQKQIKHFNQKLELKLTELQCSFSRKNDWKINLDCAVNKDKLNETLIFRSPHVR